MLKSSPMSFLSCSVPAGLAVLLSVPASAAELTRTSMVAALATDHVFSGREVVRVVHVCNVEIGTAEYPVIDLVEQVRGAQVPRGDRRIVILEPNLKLRRALSYDPPAQPLFCSGATLYLSAPTTVDNFVPDGNALTFDKSGSISVTTIEPNDYPAPTSPTNIH